MITELAKQITVLQNSGNSWRWVAQCCAENLIIANCANENSGFELLVCVRVKDEHNANVMSEAGVGLAVKTPTESPPEALIYGICQGINELVTMVETIGHTMREIWGGEEDEYTD